MQLCRSANLRNTVFSEEHHESTDQAATAEGSFKLWNHCSLPLRKTWHLEATSLPEFLFQNIFTFIQP